MRNIHITSSSLCLLLPLEVVVPRSQLIFFFFFIILEELTLEVSNQAAARNNLVLSLTSHGRFPWLPLTVRSFYDCFPWLSVCHLPYGASMAAYHQPHYSSYGTLHYTTLNFRPPPRTASKCMLVLTLQTPLNGFSRFPIYEPNVTT